MMDKSPVDARGEAAEKEERFGLVRWHSLKVVPLSCVREKGKIVLDHLPVRCKCEWDKLDHYCELLEVSESKEVLEERLTMKEKNGAVLYIPEHRCWEEKGKIRKRPHSTDSVPESKRKYAINGTDEIPPLPISQAMSVNVGYPKTSVKHHGGMTMVEPMVVYTPFRDGQAKIAANHVNDAAGNTDVQMDSLKKHLEATHGQLKAEREAKKELSRTVAKLQSELGTVKAHLADYKQQLEALQAFPKPAEEDLQFLQDLLDYFYTQREHRAEVITPTQVPPSPAEGLSHPKPDVGSYSRTPPLTTTPVVFNPAAMNNIITHVAGNDKDQLRGFVICTKDPEPHMTVTSVHPERHIYTGALTGEGGHAITQVVGSTESVPTVATTLPPRVILAPAIAPTSHMTQVPPYSVVRLPINSPGSSSSSSREGEMEEEGGGSRGSSEMAGFSGDVSNPFGPYGRNGYTGLVTQDEKEQEEEALKPGPNKVELIANSGVYIKVSDLKAIEQTPKESPTALMRSFISIWYSGRLLASCSATKGINPDIKNAVFEYVRTVFPDAEYTSLQRALTSKCCEERRKIKKEFTVITSNPSPLSYESK